MTSHHLTAQQADVQVKKYRNEIRKLAGPGIALQGDGKVVPTICGDPNNTDPHAPSQYNYYYRAHGTPHDTRFLPAAKQIASHYTDQGWTTYGRTDKPSPGWDMRSPDKYLLSLTVSPDGDLLTVELDTPCVPRVDTTFTP